MQRAALIDLIVATVREHMNGTDVDRDQVVPSTPLIGPHAVLDSMGLVSTVVGVEQQLADLHQTRVTLMDDRAMSQTRSPFRTAETLADYVLGLLPHPMADRNG